MIEGIYTMLSGNLRCEYLNTKTFGLVSFEYSDKPFIIIRNNINQYRSKVDTITSNTEYDIIVKER